MFIYPYRTGSNTVAGLKSAFKGKVIRLTDSNFKGSPDKFVLNWGNSRENVEVSKCKLLNKPETVKVASNKLNLFNALSGRVRIPDYTQNIVEALDWIRAGETVFARNTLTGHSGEGISILQTEEDFANLNHNDVKLYVKYVLKKDEFDSCRYVF